MLQTQHAESAARSSQTRLFLTRHGQTDWNLLGRYAGWSDTPHLTPEGRKQARMLAKRLAGQGFAAVYSSPLRRALETAQLLTRGQEIRTLPDLRERNYGDVDGLTMDELRSRFPGVYTLPLISDFPTIPNAEPWPALQERGLRALRDIASRHAGDVLVVWHGAIMRAAFSRLLGWGGTDLRLVMGNCSLNIVEGNGSGLRVELLNDLPVGGVQRASALDGARPTLEGA